MIRQPKIELGVKNSICFGSEKHFRFVNQFGIYIIIIFEKPDLLAQFTFSSI